MSERRQPIWDGVYQTFEEADGDVDVFEGRIWLDKLTSRAQASIEASQEQLAAIPASALSRDSVLPILAAVLSSPTRPVRILDFGGGLGASYELLDSMLPTAAFQLVVIENPVIAQKGDELFSTESRVEFRSALPTESERFEIVYCGSSLHYVDDWSSLLVRLVGTQPAYLIFTDLPAADNRTFVTTQAFHGRRIPVRFWNLNEFVRHVSKLRYELIYRARYSAPFLGSEANLPTSHFDSHHRLDYCSQLVFRRQDS